jgi:hypothetical protein
MAAVGWRVAGARMGTRPDVVDEHSDIEAPNLGSHHGELL